MRTNVFLKVENSRWSNQRRRFRKPFLIGRQSFQSYKTFQAWNAKLGSWKRTKTSKKDNRRRNKPESDQSKSRSCRHEISIFGRRPLQPIRARRMGPPSSRQSGPSLRSVLLFVPFVSFFSFFSLLLFFFNNDFDSITKWKRIFLLGVLLGFTGLNGFYRVLPGFTEFYWILLGFIGFYRVLPSFTGFYRVLPGFTGFYRVPLGFTRFNWFLPGFTGFFRF